MDFLGIFASNLHALSKTSVVRVCAEAPLRLLLVHVSLDDRARASTMWSARAPIAWGKFDRNGEHSASHVGSDVTEVNVIRDGK